MFKTTHREGVHEVIDEILSCFSCGSWFIKKAGSQLRGFLTTKGTERHENRLISFPGFTGKMRIMVLGDPHELFGEFRP